jgi:hypothetical protein
MVDEARHTADAAEGADWAVHAAGDEISSLIEKL